MRKNKPNKNWFLSDQLRQAWRDFGLHIQFELSPPRCIRLSNCQSGEATVHPQDTLCLPNSLRYQEKSSRGKKFESPEKSNFFPLELFFPIFFWFIWKQRYYNNGRPLILKFVPNDEEWNYRIAWFSWNWHRKSISKWNVTVLKTDFYVKINQST